MSKFFTIDLPQKAQRLRLGRALRRRNILSRTLNGGTGGTQFQVLIPGNMTADQIATLVSDLGGISMTRIKQESIVT